MYLFNRVRWRRLKIHLNSNCTVCQQTGFEKTTCFFHLIYQLTTNNPIVMENITCKPRATYQKNLTKEPEAMKMFEAYTNNSNKEATTKICWGTQIAAGETSSTKESLRLTALQEA